MCVRISSDGWKIFLLRSSPVRSENEKESGKWWGLVLLSGSATAGPLSAELTLV